MAKIVQVPLPRLEKTSFDYNGLSQDVTDNDNLKNYRENRNYITLSGTFSSIHACSPDKPYKLIFSLKPNTSNYIYEWIDENGNTSTDAVVLEWRINPIKIKKPNVWKTIQREDGTAENIYYTGEGTLTYDYDGNAFYSSVYYKMPNIEAEYAEGKKYTTLLSITGNGTTRKYKAGSYPIVFSIKHPDSCRWDDGTPDGSTDDYTVTWEINKTVVEIPVLLNGDFTYTGSSQSPEIEGYKPELMSRRGTASAIAANEYSTIFDLRDKDSCSWIDKKTNIQTTDEQTIEWEIKKRIDYVPKPKLESFDFDYNGTLRIPTINDGKTIIEATRYFSSVVTISGTLSSVTANEENKSWEILVNLKNNSNITYQWEDEKENPTGTIVLRWYVHKSTFNVPKLIAGADSIAVSPPNADILEFDYKGERQNSSVAVVGCDSNVMSQTGVTSAYKADEYILTFRLLHKDSAEWEDHSTEDKELRWKINKIYVDIPETPKETDFVTDPKYLKYTGYIWYSSTKSMWATLYYVSNELKQLELNVNRDIISVTDDSKNSAGNYTAIMNLRDKDSCTWSDGTTEPKTVEWKIVKKIEKLKRPEFKTRTFNYDGKPHKPELKNSDDINIDNWAKIINEYSLAFVSYAVNYIQEQTKAGDYTETIRLKDWVYTSYNRVTKQSSDMVEFQWEDGSKDPIELEWSIKKSLLPPPTISPENFDYDGLSHSVSTNGFDFYTMERDRESVVSGIEAKTYYVIFSLKDKESSAWDDGSENGSTDDIVREWTITPKHEVPVPDVTNTSFEYTGNRYFPNIGEYDSNIITVKNTSRQYKADRYEIIFEFKHPGSCTWKGGGSDPKTVEWEITKQTVYCEKPSISPPAEEYKYNGKSITPTLINFDDNCMTAKCDNLDGISAVPAGEHIIIVTLKENDNITYKWNDRTDEPVKLWWHISKSTVEIPALDCELFYYGGYWYSYPWKDGKQIELEHHAWRSPVVTGYDFNIMNAEGIDSRRITEDTVNGSIYSPSPDYPRISYGSSQWQTGKYYIEFTLKDPDSCSWIIRDPDSSAVIDETNGKVIREWSIVKEIKLLPKPYLETNLFVYDGTEKTPNVVNGDNEGIELSGDLTETLSKDSAYNITAKLVTDSVYDYRWDDNTTNDIVLDWYIIGNNQIEIPTSSLFTFEYNGRPHFPVINGYNSNAVRMDGEEQIAADKYTIVFSLKHPESCTWTDETTENKTIEWYITKSIAAIPVISPKSIMYDGVYHTVEFIDNENDHSFVVKNFNSDIMEYSGSTREKDVDKYKVVIRLKDTNSCTWADGSVSEKLLPWEITKKTVLFDKPYLEKDLFVYDGTVHEPEIVGFISSGMIKVDDLRASEVSSDWYIITVTLKEDNNITYLWGDKTNEPVYLRWKIIAGAPLEKIKVTPPVLTNTEFTFDVEEHSPDISDYDDENIIQRGTSSATYAKEYSVIFALRDKESCIWTTGGTEDIIRTWEIKKAVVEPPSVPYAEFPYDGEVHAPSINGYDENDEKFISILGKPTAVNAGEHTVTFRLKYKSSCVWKSNIENDTEDREFPWKILKKSVSKPTLTNGKLTYSGGTQAPTLNGLNDEIMTASGKLSAVNAKKYWIYVRLNNTTNYQWADETSDRLSFEWEILKKSVDKPRLKTGSIVYNGEIQYPPITGFLRGTMEMFGDTEGRNVGEYITEIRPTDNYEWAGGGNESVILTWYITKISVSPPDVTDKFFVYDKSEHSPKISPFDENIINCGGKLRETNAGDYSIVFSLSDKEHCVWKNTDSSEDISVDWTIEKQKVPKPTVTNTHFIYNGGKNLPTVNGFDQDTMVLNGTTWEINAGNYIIFIKLFDTRNYMWDDKTQNVLSFPWEIGRFPIEVPYLVPETFVYNGSYRQPEIKNFNKKIMKIVGGSVTIAADADEYWIFIRLSETISTPDGNREINNYQWPNGSVDNIALSWTITPQSVNYPTLLKSSFMYDGTTHSPELNGFISKAMEITGTASAVNVKDYKVGFILKDTKNYMWKENVIEGEEYTWKITPAFLDKKLDIPIQNPILIYNGSFQIPTWNNFNKNKLSVGGVIKGRNVDRYSAEFTPTNNYVWKDGTRTPVPVPWVIEKLGIANPVQKNKLFYTGAEQSPKWNVNYNLVNIVFSGETRGINAGEYEVVCVCDDNCYFLSTESNTCRAKWEINKKALKAPYAKRKYYYTGKVIAPEFYNYDPKILNISGEANGIAIGDYIVFFEIRDRVNYVWAENVVTCGGEKTSAAWVILNSQKTAEIPYQNNHLIYNGKTQSPTWKNYNTNAMTLLGRTPFRINSGTYYVTFRLKDGYIWSDKTSEDKTLPWEINKKKLKYPYIADSESDGTGLYYYELEGKRYPVWREYYPDLMTMTGDTFDIDNSWHITYFDLKKTDNYEWEDGRTGIYTIRWKLTSPYSPEIIGGTGKKRVHIPRQNNAPISDGTTKYPRWDLYDNTAIISIGGVWEGVEAGDYHVILELREGYIWEDGTEGIKAVPWRIYNKGENIPDLSLISVHIPEQINPPYYDGFVKEPQWDEWNSFGIDYKYGDLYGVKAGTYYIKISLKTGYIWEDGTQEDKIIEWVINPREEEPDVVPDNPREPEQEKEEDSLNDGCCCCNPCCPDTGLFDKLNDYDFDDGFTCDCSEKTEI